MANVLGSFSATTCSPPRSLLTRIHQNAGVNGGVHASFINEKGIEYEIQALAATVARFAKLMDQWLTATRALNNAVKEIGDFENWMKTIEYDCRSITAAIQNIYQE